MAEEKQQESSKLKQKVKFDQNWVRIITLTGNKAPEKGVKFAQSEVVTMFAELAEERVKKAKEDFKAKLAGILDAKIALDKSVQKGRDELVKKEEQEYEKLNVAMNDAFALLEQVQKEGQQLVQTATGEQDFPPKENA